MSTSTQYNAGTSYSSEYVMGDIFDEFFINEGAAEPESKIMLQTMLSSTPSSESIDSSSTGSPSSAMSIHTAASTPPRAPSPHNNSLKNYNLSEYNERRIDSLWNDLPGEDNYHVESDNSTDRILSSAGPTTTMSAMLSVTAVSPLSTMQQVSQGLLTPYNTQDSSNKYMSTLPIQPAVHNYSSEPQSQHTQATPVGDNYQPAPTFAPNVFHQNSFTAANSSQMSPPNSRRTSQSPPKQNQSASRRTKKSTKSARDADEAQEAKRRRFLERNRVAASKCRQKKKEWMQTLEENARAAQTTSKILHHTVGVLKDELLILKQEILKHHGCECTQIRSYLMHEAERVVQDQHRRVSVSEASPQMLLNKPRQLSIAETEMSELSTMDFDDDLDLIDEEAEDAMDLQQQQQQQQQPQSQLLKV